MLILHVVLLDFGLSLITHMRECLKGCDMTYSMVFGGVVPARDDISELLSLGCYNLLMLSLLLLLCLLLLLDGLALVGW